MSLFTSYSVNYHAQNQPKKFWGFREMLDRGVFLKISKNISVPKSHLQKHDPLILQSCFFNMSSR